MADGAVVFQANVEANTSGAVQNLKEYQTEIKSMRSELSAASKSARQDYQSQSLAAKAVGASQEDLIRITQRYAQQQLAISRTKQQMDQAFVQGNGAVAASNRTVSETLAQELAAVEALAAAEESRNAHNVSQMQAASAGLRALDGNFTNNIRSAERFTAMIPGMSGLLQTAFPVVGGIAFIAMLGKGATELYKFREEGVNAGKAIRESYDELTESTHKHGVELDLTNDKLDTQLAKINHKPANLLKTALDEDRKAAYDLTEELNRATRAESALMKEKAVGELKAVGMSLLGYNVASTTEQQRLISQQNGDLRRANKAGDDALDKADPKNAESVRQQDRINRQNAYTAAINETKKALDKVYAAQREGKGVDYSAQTSMLEGHLDELQGQYRNLTAGYQAGDKQRQVTQAEEARQRNRDGESAAKKASEAAKEAAEQQRKQWDEQAKIDKTGHERSLSETTHYWDDLANTVVKGSANWIYATNRGLEAVAAENAQREKLFDESLKLSEMVRTAQHKQVLGAVMPGLNADAKGTIDQQTSLRALIDAQRDSTYQQALAQATLDASTGKLSKYDEQVRVQVLHTEQYTGKLRELTEALAAVDGQDAESMARRNVLQKQITELTSKQQIEGARDAANVAAQTWQGALSNANAVWVQNSRDSARQVSEIYGSVMSGVNGNLLSAMTGEKTHWRSTFQSIGKQVAGFGLQRAESSAMGLLGIGKADGSRTSPLWVRMADSLTSGVKSVGGGLAGLASSVFGGFRAGGGPVEAGKSYITSEKGPELITFGRDAYVTPNHALQSAFGSNGHTFQINVDASNAHDPAATEAAVNRGIARAVPHIVAASLQAQRNDRSRTPNSRG